MRKVKLSDPGPTAVAPLEMLERGAKRDGSARALHFTHMAQAQPRTQAEHLVNLRSR